MDPLPHWFLDRPPRRISPPTGPVKSDGLLLSTEPRWLTPLPMWRLSHRTTCWRSTYSSRRPPRRRSTSNPRRLPRQHHDEHRITRELLFLLLPTRL